MGSIQPNTPLNTHISSPLFNPPKEVLSQLGIVANQIVVGDARFHAGWTLHRALPNRSRTCREVMTIIYFADGARISDPVPESARADHEAWLSGIAPGELADGELNPRLYP